jgi:hypothetical protein
MFQEGQLDVAQSTAAKDESYMLWQEDLVWSRYVGREAERRRKGLGELPVPVIYCCTQTCRKPQPLYCSYGVCSSAALTGNSRDGSSGSLLSLHISLCTITGDLPATLRCVFPL